MTPPIDKATSQSHSGAIGGARLKFLLHFVGDLHQPPHSADNGDRDGNSVKVIVDGFPHKSKDELHGFWDTQFVDALGGPPAALASQLLDHPGARGGVEAGNP
jgi:hypothetical protein